jgi:hypothetical protein
MSLLLIIVFYFINTNTANDETIVCIATDNDSIDFVVNDIGIIYIPTIVYTIVLVQNSRNDNSNVDVPISLIGWIRSPLLINDGVLITSNNPIISYEIGNAIISEPKIR